MSRILLKTVLFLLFGTILSGSREFKQVDKWRHDQLMPGTLFDAVVDQDGDLIAAFSRAGVKIADKNKITDLGPFGQGPNDIDGFYMLCFYKGDLAVEGQAGKLKIFHKKDGKYTWKQTIWKKFGMSSPSITDGKFMAGKWFFSGYEEVPVNKNRGISHYTMIYEENGKYIKSLIQKEITRDTYVINDLKNYFIEIYKDNVFFIPEDEPVIKIISPQLVEVKREVKLKMPGFYKSIPPGNYKPSEKYRTMSHIELRKTWAEWKTNYSRIERTAVDGNHLVLQIRTCTKDLKRFALLLYNLETFKLDRIELTDDLLLTVKDGNYYLFENGNPSYDDEAGDFVINIHRFEEK